MNCCLLILILLFCGNGNGSGETCRSRRQSSCGCGVNIPPIEPRTDSRPVFPSYGGNPSTCGCDRD